MKAPGLEPWYERNRAKVQALIDQATKVENIHLRSQRKPLLNQDGVLLQFRGDKYVWKWQLVALEDSSCRVLVGWYPVVKLIETKQEQTTQEMAPAGRRKK